LVGVWHDGSQEAGRLGLGNAVAADFVILTAEQKRGRQAPSNHKAVSLVLHAGTYFRNSWVMAKDSPRFIVARALAGVKVASTPLGVNKKAISGRSAGSHPEQAGQDKAGSSQ
jgi:hypothetical protein